MKKQLLALLLLVCIPAIAQQKGFKPNLKTQHSGIDVARLIGAGVIDASQQPVSYLDIKTNGLRNLAATPRGFVITRDSATHQPIFIEGKLPANKNARTDATSAAFRYLTVLKKVLQVENPDHEFTLKSIETDQLQQTHLRLEQIYKGIPVYGAELVLHEDKGEIAVMNGRIFPTPNLTNLSPDISQQQAIALALENVGKHAILQPTAFGQDQLLKYNQTTARLIIYHTNDNSEAERLAWQLMVRPNLMERWQYIIDAQNGAVLLQYNHTCAFDGPVKATASDLNGISRSIGTYQQGSAYYMIDTSRPMYKAAQSKMPDDPIGVLWTINASNSTVDNMTYRHVSSTNNTWNNPTAVSAHTNAGTAYEYYRQVHGRNSLNGKGGNIVSIINIADEDGKGFDNAFWNGEFMGYGNGRSYFKPLAGGLDVAGHEMTHGVVENSANLEYNGQSGAINESMADCFGAMIDRDDWVMGEDVVLSGAYPTGFLRSLQDPNAGGSNSASYQPRTMTQYYTGSQDNYGVHINSGIPNWAFYKFATATAVGKDKAEKVYYRTLTTYLTAKSRFLDLRLAVVRSATDLYGASSAEVAAAKAAFDAVGIADPSTSGGNTGGGTGGTTTSTPVPIPTNTGQDFILSYDPVDKKLYSSATNATNFVAKVSGLSINHKPSVTDDGKYAYFVASDKIIRRVNLSGTPNIEAISSTAVWDNVAVSKDGKHLAALTKDPDKSIYVYDLSTSPVRSKKFVLYNPTYSGVNTAQVLYADAIEWDISGEFLVYDAFNNLNSPDGTKVEYWDVGFIGVWNNSTNDFSTGTVQKLFTSLDKGESIGNPSFSKNSTNIVTFDYNDEIDNYYAIYNVDVTTKKVEQVFENNTLGYPDFSRTDNRLVFNYQRSGGNLITATIALNTDKLTPTGSATALIEDSQLATWYTIGTRSLPQRQNQSINFDAITDKADTAPPFAINAQSSAGLPLGFSIAGPATLDGNMVTLTGSGKVDITAFQEGNTAFYRATPNTRSFNVGKITATNSDTIAQIVVSPNPATDKILIQLPLFSGIESISLHDINGRICTEIPHISSSEIEIPMSNFPTGTYILSLKMADTVIQKKIMKR